MKAKHSLVYSLFILVMVQMLVSCVYRENVLVSDSKRITQQRLLRGFERIDIYGSPTVYYTQADSFSVRLEGPENILSEVLTEVEGNVLSVRNKGKIGIVNISVGSVGDVNVYVSSPDLIGVTLRRKDMLIPTICPSLFVVLETLISVILSVIIAVANWLVPGM